jgi:hypothetical protein
MMELVAQMILIIKFTKSRPARRLYETGFNMVKLKNQKIVVYAYYLSVISNATVNMDRITHRHYRSCQPLQSVGGGCKRYVVMILRSQLLLEQQLLVLIQCQIQLDLDMLILRLEVFALF